VIIAIDILKFIILVLVTFFMCQIISNGNKRISYIGTLLICFSTAIIEYINSGLVEVLIFGQLFVIALDKILKNEKFKVMWLLLIPVSILGFGLLSNISFQIPIGIAILTIILWRILKYNIAFKNKVEVKKDLKKSQKDKAEKEEEKNKLDKKNLIIMIVLIIIGIIITAFFYQYEKIESLENKIGSCYLMNYTYSVMMPFNKNIKFENASCLATMISIFPIGLFIAIWYIFKIEDKHSEFLIPTIIVSILELIILLSNKFVGVIPNYIFSLGFAVLQIYMIVYIFANIEEKLFTLKQASYISLLGIIVILLLPFPNAISTVRDRALPYIMFVIESFMLLNYADKRFWRLSSWIMTIICLFESISYLVVNCVL
jgi:hypothetical protein